MQTLGHIPAHRVAANTASPANQTSVTQSSAQASGGFLQSLFRPLVGAARTEGGTQEQRPTASQRRMGHTPAHRDVALFAQPMGLVHFEHGPMAAPGYGHNGRYGAQAGRLPLQVEGQPFRLAANAPAGRTMQVAPQASDLPSSWQSQLKAGMLQAHYNSGPSATRVPMPATARRA